MSLSRKKIRIWYKILKGCSRKIDIRKSQMFMETLRWQIIFSQNQSRVSKCCLFQCSHQHWLTSYRHRTFPSKTAGWQQDQITRVQEHKNRRFQIHSEWGLNFDNSHPGMRFTRPCIWHRWPGRAVMPLREAIKLRRRVLESAPRGLPRPCYDDRVDYLSSFWRSLPPLHSLQSQDLGSGGQVHWTLWMPADSAGCRE